MDQKEGVAAALCAVTATVLDHDGAVTMDEGMVAKSAADDPTYQLLLNKVLTGD